MVDTRMDELVWLRNQHQTRDNTPPGGFPELSAHALKASQYQPKCRSQLSPANRGENTSSNREGRVASMIANNTGTHLETAPHLVQILQQP